MRHISCGRLNGEMLYALVDDADAPWALGFKWHHTGRPGKYYATRIDESGRQVFMHREVLGLARGDKRQGDHINLNRLDNRRSNLRIVTHAEQAQNQGAVSGGTSRYRGVSLERKRRGRPKWVAKVGRRKLGYYESEMEAAQAASEWRREHMPFAVEDAAA